MKLNTPRWWYSRDRRHAPVTRMLLKPASWLWAGVTARKIARHYNHDEEFQIDATRYLDQFEELIRRVLKDPDGEAFALVLLSSDIGKLYVMISEAIGRPIARRAA